MSKGQAKAPSQRQLRVGEEIRHALAWTLERDEVRDPSVQGVPVTVTEVRVSPDLKNATAFVVPLGAEDGDAAALLEGLLRAAPFLRRRIGEKVRLRHVPRLSFVADQSFDNAGRIDALLRRPDVARDLFKPAEEDDGDGA